MSIELVGKGDRALLRAALFYDDDVSSIEELDGTGKWSGRLPHSGSYHLLISGSNESDEARLSYYQVRLWLK